MKKDPYENFDVFGSWNQAHWSAEASEIEDDLDEPIDKPMGVY